MSVLSLQDIPTRSSQKQEADVCARTLPFFKPSQQLNSIISLWQGDITRLKVDAIVNSIHGEESHGDYYRIIGGDSFSTVADCIYKAGGESLFTELVNLMDLERLRDFVVTRGHKLPAKYVIHVEGPVEDGADELAKCYTDSLFAMVERNLRSIAFPCISTGYKSAANVALQTVRKWLDHENNSDKVDRIIFCVFQDKDYTVYTDLLPSFFPHPQKIITNTVEALDLATRCKEQQPNDTPALEAALARQTRRVEEAEMTIRQDAARRKGLQDLVSELRRSGEEKSQRIADREGRIQTLENRVRRLEGELYNCHRALGESHQQADRVEREKREVELRLSNSDTVFQEVLQRLIGQIPQSQPFWVVSRREIHFTSEELGAGGWANVKVALVCGQRVAAKCLHHQIISAHNIRLFTREMNIAAHARHPNLLQFIGATMDDEPIILTELLPTSLRNIMESTALSRQQIQSIGCDIARALNYLHLATPDPIIHRDISSANVLLEPSGEATWKAKVSDYGSANFVRYTTTVGPGNPLYSAPEAAEPKRHSPKMDVYSFGMLLVEMCSGELFDDYEVLIRSNVQDWELMLNIVRQCMQHIPQRRPAMSDVITPLLELVQ